MAVPLWLVLATTAPRSLVSGNDAGEHPARGGLTGQGQSQIGSPAVGVSAYRRSGVAFLVSCSRISLAAGVPSWAAVTLLLSAVAVHTVGELWHAGGGFEVSFALAPARATGQYLGVFGLGAALADAFGPGLLIALCLS